MNEQDIYFKHGMPKDQWKDLEERKIPLSIRIISEDWTAITLGETPDLTLAHYLASRFISLRLPIPSRIKDAIVDGAPSWARESLNRWNKEKGRHTASLGFGGDIIREPMMAIASSLTEGYIQCGKEDDFLEQLALTIFEISSSLHLVKATEDIEATTIQITE